MNRRRLLSGFERSIYDRNDLDFNEYAFRGHCKWQGGVRLAYETLLLKLVKYWPKIADAAVKYIDYVADSTIVNLLNIATENGNYKFISNFLNLNLRDTTSCITQLSVVRDSPFGRHNYRAINFLVHKYVSSTRKSGTSRRNIITDVNELGAFDLLMVIKRQYFITYESILSATPHRAQIIRKFWRGLSHEDVQRMKLLHGDGVNSIFTIVSLFNEDTALLVRSTTTAEQFRQAVARHRECSVHCVDLFHKSTCLNGSNTELGYLYIKPFARLYTYVTNASRHPLHCDCDDTKTRDELRRMFPTGTDMTQLDILDAEELRRELRFSQAQHRPTEEIS